VKGYCHPYVPATVHQFDESGFIVLAVQKSDTKDLEISIQQDIASCDIPMNYWWVTLSDISKGTPNDNFVFIK
jgi:hypothetical protein